ncbi:MAG: succinate dehydrogenase assembly factor 2 [Halioglobus sp.]
MIEAEELNRMRWAARRGMLELDLILEPFATTQYARLSESDRKCFQQLMLCEDQDLFAWLLQRSEPLNQELAGIVRQILTFTHTLPDSR